MKTQLLALSTGAGRPLGGAMVATTEPVVELPPRPFVPATPGRAATAIAAQRLSEFDLQYDADQKILWCYFDFTGRPCFSSTVLEEAQRAQRAAKALDALRFPEHRRGEAGGPGEVEIATEDFMVCSRSEIEV